MLFFGPHEVRNVGLRQRVPPELEGDAMLVECQAASCLFG
jgi:hypothetical protein